MRHSAPRLATPRAHNTSIVIPDDLPDHLTEVARIQLLQNFRQGVPAYASGKDAYGATTSRHFPNARINESTAEPDEQVTNMTRAHGHSNDLRTFRRAGVQTTEDHSTSEDELGMEPPQDNKASASRQRSPAKSSQTAKKGDKRTPKEEIGDRILPLKFVRSRDFEERDDSESVHEHPALSLRPGPTDTWRIVSVDPVTRLLDSKGRTILPKHVVKIIADDTSRIRLEGPRPVDGNSSIFDLEFKDTTHFRSFRDSYAKPLARQQKVIMWDEEHMKMLFCKPLSRNDKVVASPLLKSSHPVAEYQSTSESHPSKPPLWTRMKDSAQSSGTPKPEGVTTGATRTVGPSQSSARAVRSTRSTAPNYNVDKAYKSREIEKFSVDQGLGEQWLRPLTYVDGVKRATIYFDDLARLDEEEFLNDSLIDFYMIYLSKTYKLPQHKVFFFNTYFYTRLTQNTGRASMNYDNVARWTSKIDVFEYDYIVVPINEDIHWYLAIICNVGNIPRELVQEGFDGGVVADVSDASGKDGDQVESVVPIETDISATAQLVQESRATTSPKPSLSEQQESELNLFDEEAKLDLINRDNLGPEAERTESAEASPIPQSPQVDEQHNFQPIFEQEEVPKPTHSSLKMSTEKKKPKRKSMGPKKDPTHPVIIILDSMTQTRSHAVRALKDWLTAEGNAKRGMEAVIKEKGFYPKAEQIPTQNNFTDCGVYVLGYAAKFFQDPDEFKRKLLTGEMLATEDWPELKPKDMRRGLRDLLFSLAEEQKLKVPAKKKKEKNTAPGAKSSPPHIDAEPPANLKHHDSPDKELKNSRSVKISKSIAEPTSSVHREVARSTKSSTIRLASPFESTNSVTDTNHGSSVEARGMVSRPPAQIAAVATSQKQTPGRRIHPKVHIPGLTPPSQQSHGPPRQRDRISRSTSPLKRVWNAADDEEENASPKKKRTVQTQQTPRTGSTLSQNRQGNSDHPIEIQDSQEIKSTATQSPQRPHLGSPVRKKRNHKSPQTPNKLLHEPSFQELSCLPPQVAPRKPDPSERKDISTLLEASLDADDQVRNVRKRAKSRSVELEVPSTDPEQADETVLDLMEVDSQGLDPMDMAEDGTFVRETPEPARRSPPLEESWVAGKTLLR
jgi:sentrin-specific protease 7